MVWGATLGQATVITSQIIVIVRNKQILSGHGSLHEFAYYRSARVEFLVCLATFRFAL